MIELIGEEIYDEFDPQGHPELAYADTKPKSSMFKISGNAVVRRRRSAPQLVRSSEHDGVPAVPAVVVSSPPSSVPDSSTVHSHPGRALVPHVAKPSALRGLNPLNLRNIGKLSRSRSAPPTPRDVVAARPKDGDSTPAPVPEGIAVESPEVVCHDFGPSISVSQVDPTNASDSLATADTTASIPSVVHVDSRAQARLSPAHSPSPLPVVSTSALPPILAASSRPTSRSASPSPSLEHAILLERKRRAASAGAGSMPAPKGLRFKSSPLTGAGGVVAENSKRGGEEGASIPRFEKDNQEGSIPRLLKDKEGPDIEKAQDGADIGKE